MLESKEARSIFIAQCLILFLFLLTEQPVNSLFAPGRIPPGSFEYEGLNGVMPPLEAAALCENDIFCGGFTFQGAALQVPHQIYFFHYVTKVEIADFGARDYWLWTSYTANRGYIVLPGLPQQIHGSLITNSSLDLVEDPESGATLCRAINMCVAVSQNPDTGLVHALEFVDFVMVHPHPTGSTLILLSARTTQIFAADQLGSLHRCCPDVSGVQILEDNLAELQGQIAEESCSISPDMFVSNYVMQRKPVVLKGCLDSSLFRPFNFGTFTFDSILHRLFGSSANLTQSAFRPRLRKQLLSLLAGRNFTVDSDFVKEMRRMTLESSEDLQATPSFTHLGTPNNESVKYEQVLASRKAGDLRTFVRVSALVANADCLEAFRRRDGQLSPVHQVCMVLDGLWKPNPIPSDLYGPAQYNNDLGWIILSEKASGSNLHQDPDLMGAWNLLLIGRKWWAIHPAPLHLSNINCNGECSHNVNEAQSTFSWFHHVVPQLRRQRFYGSSLIEFVQEPGDALYLPHGMPHAVYNLDDTVALTENYLFMDALPNLMRAVAEDDIRGWVPSWSEDKGIKTLYMQHANAEVRAKMRAAAERIGQMADRFPSRC